MAPIARLRPRDGVLILVVALLICSAALWLPGLTTSATVGPPVLGPQLPWWALAPLAAAAELTVVNVQVRREAQAISLSEITLMLGLFLATPTDMLIGVVLGAGAVYVVHRRQSVIKALFNITLRIFGVSLTIAVFHALAGTGLGPGQGVAQGFGPRAWLAAIVAVAVAGAVDGILVLGVVALHEGTMDGHHLRREVLSYPPVSAIVGSLGLVCVTALHADPRNGILLLVVGAALAAAHRAYAVLHDRHISLARLYDIGRAVSEAQQVDEVIAEALAGAREILRAEVAEIVLFQAGLGGAGQRWVLAEGSSEPGGHPLDDDRHPSIWRPVLDHGGSLLLPRGTTDEAGGQLVRLGYHEGVVVALQDESGVVGTLLVAQRMGQVRTFQASDVQLLETVANQAGLALRKGQLLERLGHEARHDILTGLANRAKFGQALTDALAAIDRDHRAGLALLLLDLNGFKEVNDSLGHHGGDDLLVHVAAQLVAAAPPDAIVARLGGDEFAVLLPNTATGHAAHAVAERLHHAVAEPFVIDGVDVAVGTSIGITLAPTHGRDPSRLMRNADAAMYAAKVYDGGIRIHEEPPDDKAEPAGRTRLALLAELRGAIERDEITVFVQPQARTHTGEVFGAEALIRWNHPQLGTLPPAEFLPLAERHGLMPELTQAALDQATAAAAQWRTLGVDLAISVNLSARSLGDSRLIPMVESTLRRHGLPPSRLTLVVTEDSVMDDPARAIALLEDLHAIGVRLSVDDFGTGYSSLSYLRRLPVHEVKIDRSFITELTHDHGDQLIVRSIIDLAANMSLDVIAEGVEDQPCWDQLAALDCTAVQGYFLARPMPLDDLIPWLNGYRTHLLSPNRPIPTPRTAPHLRVV